MRKQMREKKENKSPLEVIYIFILMICLNVLKTGLRKKNALKRHH